jgi:hypothetical protein
VELDKKDFYLPRNSGDGVNEGCEKILRNSKV